MGDLNVRTEKQSLGNTIGKDVGPTLRAMGKD
jgi:hypothetical protein